MQTYVRVEASVDPADQLGEAGELNRMFEGQDYTYCLREAHL